MRGFAVRRYRVACVQACFNDLEKNSPLVIIKHGTVTMTTLGVTRE